MTKPAIVLIVDDEISNIEIMNAALEDSYEICFATSGEEAIATAHKVQPDIILLDVIMPGLNGFDVCERLKQDGMLADVPIIFTTSLNDVEDEMRGLSLGAIDYVTKPVKPAALRARVGNHVEMKRMRDQLAQIAVTDALTGLSNRRHMEQKLGSEVARLTRTESWLSVIMLDIDFFKAFNDTYGHPAGDKCIAMVASALNRAERRASDMCARYGGEEFACILPDTNGEGALKVAADIRKQINLLHIPHEHSSVSPLVTVSIGIVSAPCLEGMPSSFWTDHADRQLYCSKVNGRNQISSMVYSRPYPSFPSNDIDLSRLKAL